MKIYSLMLVAPILISVACSSQKALAPVALDKSNYVFDFNQNGIFEIDEYQSYCEYKRTRIMPDKAIDLNHDGRQSYEELERIMDYVHPGQPKVPVSVLEQMKKIPGVSIQKIEKDSDLKK